MPGLNLSMQGGVRASAGNGFSSSAAPSSATEAAFGPAYGGGMPSNKTALAPNDPFGVAFWTGVAALSLLLLVRYSLPA